MSYSYKIYTWLTSKINNWAEILIQQPLVTCGKTRCWHTSNYNWVRLTKPTGPQRLIRPANQHRSTLLTSAKWAVHHALLWSTLLFKQYKLITTKLARNSNETNVGKQKLTIRKLKLVCITCHNWEMQTEIGSLIHGWSRNLRSKRPP